MSSLDIIQVPVLGDNYVHLLHDVQTGATAAVDPAEAGPVKSVLDEKGWRLSHILITHDHGDHTGGNAALKREYGCHVIGAKADLNSIPGLDTPVSDGDTLEIGYSQARVMEVPGHTLGHVAYYFDTAKALFPGDTLFVLGCGRLFGGSAGEMWSSLKRLRGLPGDTLVYCAHEYSEANARFALSVDPANPDLISMAERIAGLRASGQSTVPSTMAEEKAANPFLRADDPGLQSGLGLSELEAAEVFAEIRRRKDRF